MRKKCNAVVCRSSSRIIGQNLAMTKNHLVQLLLKNAIKRYWSCFVWNVGFWNLRYTSNKHTQIVVFIFFLFKCLHWYINSVNLALESAIKHFLGKKQNNINSISLTDGSTKRSRHRLTFSQYWHKLVLKSHFTTCKTRPTTFK